MKNLISSILFYFKSEPHKNFLMAKAISDASFDEIQKLHKMGICFPKDKAPYSYLFQKSPLYFGNAQSYVVKNIDDIAFGNQVILRTLLHPGITGEKHKGNVLMIEKSLQRYTEQYTSKEITELIYKIFGRRIATEESILVKDFYDYHMHKKEVDALKEELEAKDNGIHKVERKRMKI